MEDVNDPASLFSARNADHSHFWNDTDNNSRSNQNSAGRRRHRALIGHGSLHKLNPKHSHHHHHHHDPQKHSKQEHRHEQVSGNNNKEAIVYFPWTVSTDNDKNDTSTDDVSASPPFQAVPPSLLASGPLLSQQSQPQESQQQIIPEGTIVQLVELPGAKKKKKKKHHHKHNKLFVSDNDPFAQHLNWATTDNPDGVAIVHPAVHQGNCGSCWALAATGSLEASVARHVAAVAYLQEYQRQVETNQTLASEQPQQREIVHESAMAHAQTVQQETFATTLNLSIQELLDCDTSVDQGCTGGNPLLAFDFIYKYGLVHWQDYPYEYDDHMNYYPQNGGSGTSTAPANQTIPAYTTTPTWLSSSSSYSSLSQHSTTTSKSGKHSSFMSSSSTSVSSSLTQNCRYNQTRQAVATVHAWGRLPVNSEEALEWMLRHVGPLAVALNGAAPSFLDYNGGIYRDYSCRTTVANHALLLVGYGQEDVQVEPGTSNTTVYYWIARNSWGTEWGENGLVRIERRGPKVPKAGICGLAANPSIALGGRLVEEMELQYRQSWLWPPNRWWSQTGKRDSSLQPLQRDSSDSTSTATTTTTEAPISAVCRTHDNATATTSLACSIHVWMVHHPATVWWMIQGTCFALVWGCVVWLLTMDCRKRRRRRRRRRQQQQQQRRQEEDDDHDELDPTAVPHEATPLLLGRPE